MSAVTVAVHWWARSETPQEQAERWLALLARLTELSDGELREWRWDVDDDGPGPLVPRSAGELATALQAANTHDDVGIIGWTAHVVGRRPDGGYVQVWVSAGGTNEHSPFFVIVKLFPGPGASASPLADRLAEILAALADAWDPDTGLAYDRELFRTVKAAYGLAAPAPRCGWSVYLSENRAARVPGDFTARRLPTEHGGLVLDLAASPGETPDTETVLAAHRALAGSGALEPMPVPATGAKL
ncbi:hypothetical protein OR263_00875 [Streptomyces sp. NEAU-H22]|uniref:Imm52 family immunity protein n=1 Tax=unclassified Streptomyces TaxID=2593676 RepID=UPI002257A987|nr:MULTISPECIES: hypothetical protein [unclassified Streptomyces]MCX3285288.1 hypothetical protein [Streptomyces sp. NEAU-H22]WMD03874.1 hypothetical protein Q7C01_05500 [Streptomyces sp. FXY-T5]